MDGIDLKIFNLVFSKCTKPVLVYVISILKYSVYLDYKILLSKYQHDKHVCIMKNIDEWAFRKSLVSVVFLVL